MTPKMIGLLMAEGEADVIQEVLDEAVKQGIETIYALVEDDATAEIVSRHPNVVYVMRDRDCPQPFTDGARGYLFEKACKEHGYGHWIFPLLGDEIFHCDVKETVERTHETHNMLYSLLCTFVLHGTDREALESGQEDLQESIQKRRRWHFFFFKEPRAFRSVPGMKYDYFEPRRIIPGGVHLVPSDLHLFTKNYPARNPEQLARRVERRVRTKWQPDMARIAGYVNSLAQVHHEPWNVNVFWSPLQRTDGTFSLYERHDGIWNNVLGSDRFRGPPVKEPPVPPS